MTEFLPVLPVFLKEEAPDNLILRKNGFEGEPAHSLIQLLVK